MNIPRNHSRDKGRGQGAALVVVAASLLGSMGTALAQHAGVSTAVSFRLIPAV